MPRHGQKVRGVGILHPSYPPTCVENSGRIEAFESLKAGRWRIRSARFRPLASIVVSPKSLAGWVSPGAAPLPGGRAAPIRRPDGFVEKAIWRLLASVTYSLTNFPAAGGHDTVMNSF